MSEIKSKKSGGATVCSSTALKAYLGTAVVPPDLSLLDFDVEMIGKAVWMGKRL